MKRAIITIIFCFLSIPALGDEDRQGAASDTKYFMLGVYGVSHSLHDTLEDAANSYIIKCGKAPDVATLKKIATKDKAFFKMLAIRSMKQNGEKSESLDVSDMARYAAAAQDVSCLNK